MEHVWALFACQWKMGLCTECLRGIQYSLLVVMEGLTFPVLRRILRLVMAT
jgi:hypothetical protein